MGSLWLRTHPLSSWRTSTATSSRILWSSSACSTSGSWKSWKIRSGNSLQIPSAKGRVMFWGNWVSRNQIQLKQMEMEVRVRADVTPRHLLPLNLNSQRAKTTPQRRSGEVKPSFSRIFSSSSELLREWFSGACLVSNQIPVSASFVEKIVIARIIAIGSSERIFVSWFYR